MSTCNLKFSGIGIHNTYYDKLENGDYINKCRILVKKRVIAYVCSLYFTVLLSRTVFLSLLYIQYHREQFSSLSTTKSEATDAEPKIVEVPDELV